MVAITDLQLRFDLEIKDENDNELATVRLHSINVEHRGLGTLLEPEFQRHGKLRAKFFTEIGVIHALCPEMVQSIHNYRPIMMNLKVMREPTARSFNLYKGCFVTAIMYLPAFNELLEVEAEWFYRESECVLNLPEEFIERNEMTARIGIIPTRAVEFVVGEETEENSISTADWRQFGF